MKTVTQNNVMPSLRVGQWCKTVIASAFACQELQMFMNVVYLCNHMYIYVAYACVYCVYA